MAEDNLRRLVDLVDLSPTAVASAKQISSVNSNSLHVEFLNDPVER